MKKFISFTLVVTFILAVAVPVFAQMNDDADQVRHESPQMEMKGKKWKKGKGDLHRHFDPKKIATYSEEEQVVWREIMELHLKKEIGIYLVIGAALAISLATIGGAIAQGKVATAAMEGIARNPEASGKIFTPLIISLALIESLVIYALVIAFMLQGKL